MRMIATILASMALSVTPAEATKAALADAQSFDAQWRPQTRWLVCESAEQQVAVNYVLNAVSRSRQIRPAKVVAGQADGKALLRIDLVSYANPRDVAKSYAELVQAWERLVQDDPYFGIKTQVVVAGDKAPRTVRVDGGWVGVQNAVALRNATGSAGAVLRADYFIARVAAQDYYAWAGIEKKQGEFLASQGVDKGVIEKLAADSAANLFRSGITKKSRRVVRLPMPTGSTWITLDVDKESPDRSAIRNPIDVDGPQGKQRFNFQASEIFFTRPNKFWGTALYNAAGDRQDTVPDAIAKDEHAQDGIVRPLVSCVRCHSLHGGNNGLQSFQDDQTALLSGAAAILKSYSPEVAARIGELYQPAQLNREMQRDREDYAAAVKQACGCDEETAILALSGVYQRYVFDSVGRSTAANECGVGVDMFVLRTAASNDPIVLAIRSGKPVTRKDWESSFSNAMLYVGK